MDIGVIDGFTDRYCHVRTLAGTIDLPYLSTYTPVLDEQVTIQDGVVVGAVVASGPEL